MLSPKFGSDKNDYPKGIVVNEKTNGIVAVNGHSYEGADKKTENTNLVLMAAKHFLELFNIGK